LLKQIGMLSKVLDSGARSNCERMPADKSHPIG
jgi:hypothetical protein